MKFSKSLLIFGLLASGAHSAVPTVVSPISDVMVNYGAQAQSMSIGSNFGNSPSSWQVKSTKGKIFVDHDGSSPYFNYYALPGKTGADTLIFRALNASGSISDTAQFFIKPMNQPLLGSPIADLSLEADGVGAQNMSAGFTGYIEQYSVRSLRGKISVIHPDPGKGQFSIRTIDGQRGDDSIIVTAKNPVGTAIDTFKVQIKDVAKPVFGYPSPDLTLDFVSGTSVYTYLSSSFSGTVEKYSARSAKGLFLVSVLNPANGVANVQAISGRYGIDTMYIEASNRAGSAYDTILVNIPAPKPLTSTGVGIADMGMDFGSTTSKNVGGFFSGAFDRLTVTPLRGKVSCQQYSPQSSTVTLNAIPGQTGTDSIVLMVQSGSTILRDTFLVTIWSGTGPIKPSLSDMEIEQGSSAILTPNGSYIYGTSYQFSSKYGKVALIENEPHTGYINVFPLPGQVGIDTVYLTLSNNLGTQKDTLQITIKPATAAPARIQMIPDQKLAYGANDNSFVTGNYFKGKISHYSLQSLHSKVGFNPMSMDSYRTSFYAMPGQSGIDTVIITASGDLGSASDTFQVVVASPVVPVRVYKNPSLNLVYGGNDATFIGVNPFAGDVQSYEFSSLHGRAKGEYREGALAVLSVSGQTGRDSLVIKAIGQAGIAFDTIEVNISAPQVPLHIGNSVDLIFESDKVPHELVNVNFNFSPSPDHLTYKFLRGGLHFVSQETMVVNAGFSGFDTLLITATNSAGSTTDTLQIQVLPQRLPVRARALADYNMQANLRSGLISIASIFTGGLDTLTIASKNGKTTPSVPSMASNGFYITSLGNAGDDTLLLSASNSKGTAYDTIVVHISAPTVPVIVKRVGDFSMDYHSAKTLLLENLFAGVPSGFSFTSKAGKVSIDQSTYAANGRITINAIQGKFGLDTLLLTGSNSMGSTVDTVIVEILPPVIPTLVAPASDFTFASSSETKLIDLKSIFAGGADSYNFKSLSGKTQATLQNNGSAYALSFVGAQSGADTLIITASNGAGSASDTIVVQYNFTAANLPTLPSLSVGYVNGVLELWSADWAQIELVDLFGRNLLRDSLRGHRQIRMDLAPGFYVLRIWNSGESRQLEFRKY